MNKLCYNSWNRSICLWPENVISNFGNFDAAITKKTAETIGKIVKNRCPKPYGTIWKFVIQYVTVLENVDQ